MRSGVSVWRHKSSFPGTKQELEYAKMTNMLSVLLLECDCKGQRLFLCDLISFVAVEGGGRDRSVRGITADQEKAQSGLPPLHAPLHVRGQALL